MKMYILDKISLFVLQSVLCLIVFVNNESVLLKCLLILICIIVFFPFCGNLLFLTVDAVIGTKVADAYYSCTVDHCGLEIDWSINYPVYKMQIENGIVYLKDVNSISSDRAEERVTPPKDKKIRIRYYPRSGILIKWERMEEQ